MRVQFVVGTSIVLFATYLYNSGLHGSRSERAPRPGPIRIHDYEKTTIDRQRSKREFGSIKNATHSVEKQRPFNVAAKLSNGRQKEFNTALFRYEECRGLKIEGIPLHCCVGTIDKK